MIRSSRLIAASLFALAALACSDNDTVPPPNPVVGSYTATQFVTTGAGGQTNQLAAGSTLQITLAADGTTSGQLHMAASGGDPAFDASMAGTWTQSGNTIDFTQSADSFVRDMPFTLVANGAIWELVGNQTFSGTQIQLTLTRTG